MAIIGTPGTMLQQPAISIFVMILYTLKNNKIIHILSHFSKCPNDGPFSLQHYANEIKIIFITLKKSYS